MTRNLAVLAVALAACMPMGGASPYPTQADQQESICTQGDQTVTQTYCGPQLPTVPTGWSETARRHLDNYRQQCPRADQMQSAEKCVAKLEAIAHQQDPDAKQRRAAAKPKADRIREMPSFRELVARISRTKDQRTIVCKHREASYEHQRECDRYNQDVSAEYEELYAFLEKQGLDARDFSELGLLP